MRQECYFCHTKTVEKLIRKFKPTEEVAEDFLFSANQLLSDEWETTNPFLTTKIHRLAKEKLSIRDLYSEEKSGANQLLLEQYDEWKSIVTDSANPFRKAAKMAVVGNIIDYGAHSVNDDIVSQIKAIAQNDFAVDHTLELQKQLEKADSVLYIGDNAGEIVFDKLFIETMDHPNITFAVRGYPVINDITIYDAKQVGIDKLCKVITNGYDAPSTLLDYCSEEFLQAYNSADVIIAKGQGNFEGLMEEKRDNLFFMLMAKCDPIAAMLGVKKGDMLVRKADFN